MFLLALLIVSCCYGGCYGYVSPTMYFMHSKTSNFTTFPKDACDEIECKESHDMKCHKCLVTRNFVPSLNDEYFAILSMSEYDMSVYPQGTKDNYIFEAQDYFVHLYAIGIPYWPGQRIIVSSWTGARQTTADTTTLWFDLHYF